MKHNFDKEGGTIDSTSYPVADHHRSRVNAGETEFRRQIIGRINRDLFNTIDEVG